MNRSWIVALLLATTPAFGVTEKSGAADAETPRQLAEQLMKFVVADDMPGLFSYMGVVSGIDKAQLDSSRDDIVQQRKALRSKLGKILGSAFVSECRRGDTLTRLMFAEKRAKVPMRWRFIFYRAQDKWQLIYFYWDDKIPEFFESCD